MHSCKKITFFHKVTGGCISLVGESLHRTSETKKIHERGKQAQELANGKFQGDSTGSLT